MTSVVVAGGHSAGHIEPAMNVADALCARDPSVRITALGTVRGLDTTVIPARGHQLALIPAAPMPRRPGRAMLAAPSAVIASVQAATAILDRVNADVVVGFGGYVAAAAYLAARRRGVPIVVHEANVVVGLANRLGARLSDEVFTAHRNTRLSNATPIGVPVRPAIARLDRAGLRATARQRFGLAVDAPVLLVTGGSQGAVHLNEAARSAVRELAAVGVAVLHILGPGRSVEATTGEEYCAPGYVVVDYVDDMRYAYAAADVVLCRAGAMTCAEVAAVGLPAAFVPLPLRGGEQRRNAQPLVDAGGALLVDDADLDGPWLVSNLIPVIVDVDRRAAMSSALRGIGAADAGDQLAARVLDIVNAPTATAR